MNAGDVCAYGLKQSVRRPLSALATLVILIVPVLYPLIWLQAFWDPYGNVDNLPIAFVNEDTGALGAGLEQELRGSTDVDWQFADRAGADQGLRDKTYYAEIVIPSTFSQSIASAQPGTIEVYVDSKNNYTATLLVNQVQEHLRASLALTIASSALAKTLPNQPDLVAFLTDPVTVTQTDVNPVANMGTGSAPYFCSLALWIGALLISLVMGRRVNSDHFPAASGTSVATGQYLLYAIAGVIQAGLLTVVLFALGIDVQHGLATFTTLVVAALTSIALVYLLISTLGMLGQMASMILLILQLTACGGTFPVQLTQGGFFAALHPYMPFTYSVNALRETISGQPIDSGVLFGSLGIQLGIALAGIVLCVVVAQVRVKRRGIPMFR